MGTPDFAVPAMQAIIDSHHQLVAVVTVPDRKQGRGLKSKASPVKSLALQHQYPVLQPESLRDPDFLSAMEDCSPDLFVVVAFRILPRKLFEIPRLGAVNIHASLLPKYRGAAPIHHALMNGDKETGITIFQIDRKVDTGRILFQESTPIAETETTGLLWDRLSQMGADALVPVLDAMQENRIQPIKQDESTATRAPKIVKDDCRIDWNMSAEEIHNRIRAFTPHPGAFTRLNQQTIKLFDSIVAPASDPVQLDAGVIEPRKNYLCVGCRTGALYIKTVHRAGKRKQAVSEFLKGYDVIRGDRFGE